MVIDADEEAVFQAFQASALNTLALQNDGGFVLSVYPLRLDHSVGEGQPLIDTWNALAQDDIGFLAHVAQNLATG